MRLTVLAGLSLGLSLPPALHAQGNLHFRVVDTLGIAIPYATFSADPGGRRIADDSGRVTFVRVNRNRRMQLRVRRIGYEEVSMDLREPGDTVTIRMTPLPRTLAVVEVRERANTLLAQRGFYKRAQDVQDGAFVGEFITPEQLELLGVTTVARALAGARYVQIDRLQPDQRIILKGRGSCGMNIVLNGMRLTGTIEERLATLMPGQSASDLRNVMDVEEAVTGGAISGIEIYPSTANAPPEIRAAAAAGRPGCGTLVIWTGARR
jgi:hypothetical protein